MALRIPSRIIAPLAIGAALCAGGASAATFDFGDLATDVKAREGRELMWSDAQPDGWTVDGFTVDVTGTGYLDAGFRSRGFESAPAGLGACNDPTGDCNASDWDGIRDVGEIVTVIFDRAIYAVWTLRETTAAWYAGTGADHTLATGCARVNGVDRALSGGSFVDDLGAAATWSFEPCATGGTDFYVTAAEVSLTPPAPIPLPAGAVLLGTALAGLAGWRARRAA